MSEEEKPSKKEEDFLGVPISKLGGPALAVGAAGVILGLVSLATIFKPQIDQQMSAMQARQAYIQNAQLAAAQEQQRQLALQHQHQSPEGYQEPQGTPEQQAPEQQPEPSQQYAVEQDPFNRNANRRVRIPEYEANETVGTSRFNNIAV